MLAELCVDIVKKKSQVSQFKGTADYEHSLLFVEDRPVYFSCVSLPGSARRANIIRFFFHWFVFFFDSRDNFAEGGQLVVSGISIKWVHDTYIAADTRNE